MQIDNKFVAEGRKFALIVDNCPAHPNIDKLQAVELIFPPLNTTSKTQPMGQGVIRSLKAHYRAHVVKKYIANFNSNKGVSNINILTAMSYLAEAWDRVTSATIVNCFRKVGICTESQQQSLNDSDDPFQELANEIEELRTRNEGSIPPEMTAGSFHVKEGQRLHPLLQIFLKFTPLIHISEARRNKKCQPQNLIPSKVIAFYILGQNTHISPCGGHFGFS